MLLSGGALALHFCFWVEGIENTSITHALFFSSVTPIIIAGGMWALGHAISHGTPSVHATVRPLTCIWLQSALSPVSGFSSRIRSPARQYMN